MTMSPDINRLAAGGTITTCRPLPRRRSPRIWLTRTPFVRPFAPAARAPVILLILAAWLGTVALGVRILFGALS